VLKPWLFDVTAAIGLLRAAPRPPQPLPVLPWARAYGLTPDPGGGPRSVALIGPGPGFDPEYAMTTDLDDPVIIASVTVPGEPPGPLLIDGYALPVNVRLGMCWTRRRPRPPQERGAIGPCRAGRQEPAAGHGHVCMYGTPGAYCAHSARGKGSPTSSHRYAAVFLT
jgi:hypothetical protein